jgi:hypothetical protein
MKIKETDGRPKREGKQQRNGMRSPRLFDETERGPTNTNSCLFCSSYFGFFFIPMDVSIDFSIFSSKNNLEK